MYWQTGMTMPGSKTLRVARLVVLSSLLATNQLVAALPQQQAVAPAAQASPQSAQQTGSKPSARATKLIQYRNTKYRFTFSLPTTWKGYSTVEDTWTSAAGESDVSASGPSITLVNPQSTPSKPYQDISIMVFTHAQWDSLQRGDFVVSAANIGPGEIGRNDKYVFALPPRMIDTDNLYGWREVMNIFKGKPLRAY